MSYNREKYFERINYNDRIDISVETLTAIHQAQAFTIPFENLAIHELHNVNNPNNFINLDEISIFKKLVTAKRGGYCHENNELMAIALTNLGFKVDRLVGRVLTGPNLPRGHKILMVTIDSQKWIADVGFGGYGLFMPIPLIINQEFAQYNDHYKLIQENEIYILQILDHQRTEWKNLYQFNLEIYQAIDYRPLSYHTSHDPESIFVKNRICIMPRKEGRVILNNYDLKIVTNGEEKNIKLKNDSEYYNVLNQFFGISLSTQPKEIDIENKNSPEINIINTSDNYFSSEKMVVR